MSWDAFIGLLRSILFHSTGLRAELNPRLFSVANAPLPNCLTYNILLRCSSCVALPLTWYWNNMESIFTANWFCFWHSDDMVTGWSVKTVSGCCAIDADNNIDVNRYVSTNAFIIRHMSLIAKSINCLCHHNLSSRRTADVWCMQQVFWLSLHPTFPLPYGNSGYVAKRSSQWLGWGLQQRVLFRIYTGFPFNSMQDGNQKPCKDKPFFCQRWKSGLFQQTEMVRSTTKDDVVSTSMIRACS